MRLSYCGLRILALFANRPRVSQAGADIMRATDAPSGTIYPILARLEREGVLNSEWERARPQDLGRPRRRLYSITKPGLTMARQALSEFTIDR